MDPYLVIGGALVGLVIGATGMGAGSLLTPLLVLGFQVPAPIAVGTALMFAAMTKTGGAVAHARRGHVQWPIAGWLAAGSMPAALGTLAALYALQPDPAALAAIVKRAIGCALLLTAAALAAGSKIRALGVRLARSDARAVGLAAAVDVGYVPFEAEREARPLPTLAVGAAIGVLVTLTSVGAGVLGVVALRFLYPLLPARQIVGADIAQAVPLAFVAGLGHAALGTVDWTLLGTLLVGSLPAIYVGAAAAARLPERVLRAALAAMLASIGTRLLAG